jgi:hypothetical protein
MSGFSPDAFSGRDAFRDAFKALESDIQFHLAALREQDEAHRPYT